MDCRKSHQFIAQIFVKMALIERVRRVEFHGCIYRLQLECFFNPRLITTCPQLFDDGQSPEKSIAFRV